MTIVYYADDAEQMRYAVVDMLKHRRKMALMQPTRTIRSAEMSKAVSRELTRIIDELSAAFVRPNAENPFKTEEGKGKVNEGTAEGL
jgi:hypothetical protein